MSRITHIRFVVGVIIVLAGFCLTIVTQNLLTGTGVAILLCAFYYLEEAKMRRHFEKGGDDV